MDLSVVIPTYNRSELIRQTIPALMAQRAPDLEFEVIMVNNGSTDNTGEVLAQAEAEHRGRFRHDTIPPSGGPSAPRNRGIRMAKSEAILIIDDDVKPDPGMFEAHARFHKEHTEPGVCAVGEVYVPQRLTDDPMTVFHTFPYHEFRSGGPLEWVHFWTCCVSFKRDFMLEHGMFDESLLYFEDVEVAQRLTPHGLDIRFLPEARGEHLHKLLPSGVPAKGEFTGRWLYVFEQMCPEPLLRKRYGLLHPSIGTLAYARRLLNRAMMYAGYRPARAILRAMGAENGKRSRLSDLSYYLLFRRNMIRGYALAKRNARAEAASRENAEWIDRGEGLG